ncbi:MAG: DUF6062 family protein [Armatimonadota bacterium]|nr:DUF6062 family protein [Armatimonadota bacterium]MDR7422156.1 DUF6062 family protein [Armatimonadota bacterium]MDR7455431.1 DUF6062 family protein [Armatimonadota bacterium]MDR7456046.1 DUF6062 family protein [Armatimonadota bacterium]MDR7495392.1 DUF6062 family protein [Armatimonadota bacterium]
MQRDALFHGIYRALHPDHCAICHLSLETVERYLWGFLYERVNDPWTRTDLIAARGFCSTHAWQLTRARDSATGIAIVYRHLLEDFLDAFSAMAAHRLAVAAGRRRRTLFGPQNEEVLAREVGQWLERRRPCLACQSQWEAEDRNVAATAGALDDADFRARYEASLGLCFPHLIAVTASADDPDSLEWLVRTERGLMETLTQGLAEFWRKHDYRFHHEKITEAEAASWTRVVYKFVGAPGMVWRAQG